MSLAGSKDLSGIHFSRGSATGSPERPEDDTHRIHAEHLRQLGQIAAGVSHDLRNVLSVVALRLKRLETPKSRDPEEVLEGMIQLRRDVDLGIKLLDRLRDFVSISSVSEWRRVPLSELAHEACELSRLRLSSRRRVQIFEAHESAPEIRVQVAEVLSAMLNLLINAVDATPSGGRITVRTGFAYGGAWVQVSDNGPGLSAHVKDHLFEPFFTTKASGSGLGLFQVEKCMQNHNGIVTVESDSDQGTTFKLWFPDCAQKSAPVSPTLVLGVHR